MSYVYIGRHSVDDPFDEITSRLFVWNFALYELEEQLTSISSWDKSLCFRPSHGEQNIILGDVYCSSSACLHVPLLEDCKKLVFDESHLYCVLQNGIIKFCRRTSDIVAHFAQDLPHIDDICITADNHIYISSHNPLTRYSGIKAYHKDGRFSHNFISDIQSPSMAYDPANSHVHVADTKNNIITVYDSSSHAQMYQYGNGVVANPIKICIHPYQCSIVLDSVSLHVFDITNGRYMYSIEVSDKGFTDVCVTSDGTIWGLVGRSNRVIRLPSAMIYAPPPSLQLLCQSAILVHLDKLPAHLLPPKYTKILQAWSRQVMTTRKDSRTRGNGNEDSEHKLTVREDTNACGIRLLLERKLNEPINDNTLILSN